MKKSLKLFLSITLLLVFGITAKVYAADLASVQLNKSKFEYSQGEEVIVEVKLTKHESDTGINSISGTLVYDKTNLEFVEMQGVNGWETPTYNANNGKFISERTGYSDSSEVMFKMIFKVKGENADDVTINLKDIVVADDKTNTTAPGIMTSLNIKTDNPTPNPDGPNLAPDEEEEEEDPTQVSGNSGKDMPTNENNTPTDENIPETGIDNFSLIIAGIALVIVAIFSGIEASKIKE